MKNQTENKRTKIVWITSPSPSIYSLMYSKLGKESSDLDLLMILPEMGKLLNIKEENYKIKYLKTKEYAKITFFPWLLANILKGKKLSDFPSNVSFINLIKTLEKEKPAIVIINEFYNIYALQAARYCRKTGTKMIIQTEMQRFHSPYAKLAIKAYMTYFDKLLFGQATEILCWSKNSQKFMNENIPKYKNKISLFPAPVNTTVFYPEKNKKTKRNKNHINLLIVARMLPYKRYEDLIRTIAHLKNNTSLNFTLSIRGEGPLQDEIKALIKELDVSDKIVFLERTAHEQMRKLYAEHDVLILPSYNEAIGMVVPEAMACGLPAIVSDTCGATTYIQNGENGCLFKTFDYKDLAKKIILLKNSNKRKVMGKHAEQHIKKHYSVEIINNKFEKIINDAINIKIPRK
ncbi:MAG: glycosyltransferase family 4 protein [Candidatus Nanoarchaeia archaeon]